MKIIKILLFISIFFCNLTYANINIEFENWKKDFKKVALSKDISEETFIKVSSDISLDNATFLKSFFQFSNSILILA